jgi:hypothetical protein
MHSERKSGWVVNSLICRDANMAEKTTTAAQRTHLGTKEPIQNYVSKEVKSRVNFGHAYHFILFLLNSYYLSPKPVRVKLLRYNTKVWNCHICNC